LATKLSTRLAKVSGDENVSFSLTKFCWRGFEEKSLSLANRIEKVAGKVRKRRARAMGEIKVRARVALQPCPPVPGLSCVPSRA